MKITNDILNSLSVEELINLVGEIHKIINKKQRDAVGLSKYGMKIINSAS
jgi:hypothetical protein